MFPKKLLFSTRQQFILLLLLAVGLNFNTLFNEYAVDDEIVMTQNKFVEKGINGIPEIITQSYFKGWNGSIDERLSGGRYRPFALVVFAVEHQLFGENPLISHLINVLLFALLIALLFKLLKVYIFREQHEYLAFVTCLIFSVHPVHTEVIANVKSRDELITFILLLISLFTFIKHTEKKSTRLLLSGLFCFFLALLTRESAVTFVGIVPLILYFFFNQSIKKSVLFSIPLLIVFIGYLALRFQVVGFNVSTSNDVLYAPFLFATATQAFATKVFILLKYITLLFFPHPLSSDYSYNQIPYINLSSLQFIFSFLLMTGLFAYSIYMFKKRSLFSFCILYFFVTVSLVANFVAEVGAPMAERLLFQPSLAFCILMAVFYIKLVTRSRVLVNGVLIVILLLFSLKTFTRNAEWKNDETLYSADIVSAPNSLRINLYLADSYLLKANSEINPELKKDHFKKVIYFAKHSLLIYPNHPLANTDLVTAYSGILAFYKTIHLFLQDNNFDPSQPEAKNIIEVLSTNFYKQGNGFYEQDNMSASIQCYTKAVELNPNNIEAWYNLGGNYFLMKDTINGMKAWERVKELDPDHPLKKQDFL